MTPKYLSDEQIEQIRVLKAQGKSVDEVKSYLAGNALGTFSSIALDKNEVPNLTANPWQKKSSVAEKVATTAGKVVADIPQDITQLGRGVQRVGMNFLDNAKDAFTREGISLPSRGAGLVSAGVSAGTGLAGELFMGGLRSVATPELEKKTAETVGAGIQGVMESDAAKNISDWYNSQDEQTKFNISRLMLPAADLVTTVAPVRMFKGLLGKFTGKTEAPKPNVEAKITDAVTRAQNGDVSDAVRMVNATVDDATRQSEVTKLADAYIGSLVENRSSINRKLQEQSAEMSRGDTLVSQDDLVRALANEGIVPDVRGKLADFSTDIRNLEKRQQELFDAYRPILENARATSNIDDFASRVAQSIKESPQITATLNQANRQLGDIMDSYRAKYGDNLTAANIDQISRDANRLSKAYRDTDTFQADVYSELGRAARSWLEDNIPDEAFKQTNQEWLRLENLIRTAEIFQNQQVDVGLLGRALGSYVTTIMGSTAGMAGGGPVASVAAGILTKMGGDALADAMRSVKFSPELRARLQQTLSQDKVLVEKLKETATTQANKNIIEDMSRMLPAPKPGTPQSQNFVPIEVPSTGVRSAGTPVETAKPGAVKQPAQTGTLKQQAAKYKTVESFTNAVRSNPAWLKKFEDMGTTPEEIGRMVIGTGVTLGVLMYLEDENTPLGIGLIGAALTANPIGRKQIVELLAKNSDEAILDAMSTFVAAQKNGAMKANGKNLKFVDTPKVTADEAEAAFNTIMANAENVPELANMKPETITKLLDDVLSKVDDLKDKGATPQTTALLEEAKGKTLEEFVKAQGTPVYHGTNRAFDSFDINAPKQPGHASGAFAKGISFTPVKEYADKYAQRAVTREGGNAVVKEAVLNLKKPFIIDSESKLKQIAEMLGIEAKYKYKATSPADGAVDLIIDGGGSERFTQKLKELGYDGVIAKQEFGDEYIVFDPKTIKTRTQLEDIWKQANQ